MAGTTISVAKQAIFDGITTALAADGDTSTVVTYYSEPADRPVKEYVYMGTLTLGTEEAVTLRSGRRKRDEEYVTRCIVVTSGSGRVTVQDIEERATIIGEVIETWIADNTSLGGAVDWCVVTGLELDNILTPDGVVSALQYDITCRKRLL